MTNEEFLDKEEWMLENDLSRGEAIWEKFHSKVKFEFCDIKLKDGTELGPCWYSGKKFVLVSGDDSASFENKQVSEVRYYELLDKEDDKNGSFAQNDDEDEDDKTDGQRDVLEDEEEDEDGDV